MVHYSTLKKSFVDRFLFGCKLVKKFVIFIVQIVRSMYIYILNSNGMDQNQIIGI